MPSSARCRAIAPCADAGIGEVVVGLSNSPNSIIFVYRRMSLSSIVDILIEPLDSAAFRSVLLKYLPVGVSRSSPAFADPTVLCTAPKSENTNPSKPHSFFRMSLSSNPFSQLKVPLTFG